MIGGHRRTEKDIFSHCADGLSILRLSLDKTSAHLGSILASSGHFVKMKWFHMNSYSAEAVPV